MVKTNVQRVFIGVRASDKIVHSCMERQKGLDLSARLVNARDMHLTLVPPLSIADTSAVKSRLRSITETSDSFTLRTDCITYGPTAKKPDMLWLRLKAHEELTRLKRRLFLSFGMREFKSFIPHITIARFDIHHSVTEDEFERMKTKIDLPLRVDSIELLESPPGKIGDYITLESMPLRARAPAL